jgi:hypothetical protein
MYRIARTLVVDNRTLLLVGATALIALGNLLVYSHPTGSVSSGVIVWWAGLCAITILNVCGWRISAAMLARRKDAVAPAIFAFQRWQLLLSAVYVLGCGFRAILPRADVQRFSLFDSWMSSVMVGRSVATVAELCFVMQWALLLHLIARDKGVRFVDVVSRLLVPLIVVAEICSWYAVLTTSYIGNVIEESLWTLSGALLVISFVTLRSRCQPTGRLFLTAGIMLAVLYVTFMCTVDVPMYLSRWLEDEACGRTYLSLGQGFQDLWERRCVTLDWEEWRTEVPWMSLYFSVGVWCSIALVHAPWFAARTRTESEQSLTASA